MKHCIMWKKTRLMNGDIKTRCGYDGSIRNRCKADRCPHFQPTLLHRILDRLMRR